MLEYKVANFPQTFHSVFSENFTLKESLQNSSKST